MSTPTIKTKIAFDGEKEYKQAVSEINSALGVLSSEMKKTSAEFKHNADSIEALNAKNDVLERKLSTQQEKVAQIREALQKAGNAYGEADKRTMAWQKALYDAEAAVAETENAIRENNEALDGLNKGMIETETDAQGLGSMLGDLAGKFGFDIPDGIKKSLDGFGSFSAEGVAAAGAVAAAIAAIIAVYKELIDMTTETAAHADQILTLSQITGIDTDSVQEMQYMAELVDVSFDTISGSMSKLINKMQEVADGKDAAVDLFEQLGVSVTDADGHLRNAQDTFNDVIAALGEIENKTERDALSMDVFGKSAQDLSPLMGKTTEEMNALAQEAHNVGYVLDKELLDALGEVDDYEQRLIKTKEALTYQMSAQMAPAVVELKKEWLDFMTEGGQALIDSGIIQGLGEFLHEAVTLIQPVQDLLHLADGAADRLKPVAEMLHQIAGFLALIKDMNQIVSTIRNPFKWGQGNISTALGWNIGEGQMSNYQEWKYGGTGSYDFTDSGKNRSSDPDPEQYGWGIDPSTGQYDWYNRLTGNFDWPHNAAGTDYWRGGLTWVGESGPELVSLPRGTQIMNAQESQQAVGDTFYITMNVNENAIHDLQALVNWAKRAQETARKRPSSYNQNYAPMPNPGAFHG